VVLQLVGTQQPQSSTGQTEKTMPKRLERKLKMVARKRGYKGERADKFVYGTMRKMGWRPKKEKG